MNRQGLEVVTSMLFPIINRKDMIPFTKLLNLKVICHAGRRQNTRNIILVRSRNENIELGVKTLLSGQTIAN